MTLRTLMLWVVVLGAGFAAINIASYSDPAPSKPERPKGGRLLTTVPITPGNIPDPLAAMEASRDAFFADVQRQVEEQRRRDEEEAERQRQLEEARRRVPPRVATAGNSGTCSGDIECFLQCTRAHESDTSGGYGAVSPGGTYRGAYQFDAATWRASAIGAGYGEWANVPVDQVPAQIQDAVATYLYLQSGNRPWNGRC